MKDRQIKILRLLLKREDFLQLENLALALAVGKRTISRDLDSIERWLSLKGAKLERKPGKGIRIQTFGENAGNLLDAINAPASYIESLDSGVRKKLILLYLLYNDREIKISEMASAFFISDTSVWNDLNLIEKELTRPTLILRRHKGMGIKLMGEESQIRLEFVKVLTDLISVGTVIHYIYSLKSDSINTLEMNQLDFFLEKLNFPSNRGRIMTVLSHLSDELGYQFTMSGEAVLYFYLQLSIHRIKSGCLIEESFPCSGQFRNLGSKILTELIEELYSGRLPEGEITFLGLFAGVLETESPLEKNPLPAELIRGQEIHDFTKELIDTFGKLDNSMYYLNDKVEGVMTITLSCLVTRLRYGIPLWHGEWGETPERVVSREYKKKILTRLIRDHFSINPRPEDVNYLILYFQSLFFQERNVPVHKIRCLVCCFEGIGLASYLQSVIQKELDILDVIESTAVFKIHQEYLEKKNIELVLTTFPLPEITTPAIKISLPLDKTLLFKEITGTAKTLHQIKKAPETKEVHRTEVLFEDVMEFIETFSFLTLDCSSRTEEIINCLSRSLTENGDQSVLLARDFQEREKLGSLFFDEYDIRVFHCKSAAMEKPRAGVLELRDASHNRILFLVAPDPCTEGQRKLLSTITISFMDDHRLRKALTEGTLNDMRRALMDVYKEMF